MGYTNMRTFMIQHIQFVFSVFGRLFDWKESMLAEYM